MKTRVCNKCHVRKKNTSDHFPRRKGCDGGLAGICRVCVRRHRETWSPERTSKETDRLKKSYALRKERQQAAREINRKANPALFAARQRAWRKRQAPEYLEQQRIKAREWYSENRGKRLHDAKVIRDRARAEMIEMFGGKCECCGETEPRFLTLDHKNNDGKIDRMAAGGSGNLILYLKRNGWPKKETYSLLCFNCNCGRAYNNGICPHLTSPNLSA